MAMTSVVFRQRRPAASQLNLRAWARTEICPWWGMGSKSWPVLAADLSFVVGTGPEVRGGVARCGLCVDDGRAPVVGVGHAQVLASVQGDGVPPPGRVPSSQKGDQQAIRRDLAAAGPLQGDHLEVVDGVLL